MQIKKYMAASLKEAIEQMKAELGDEAIVLSTRVIEGRGPGSQRLFEITAGMDGKVAAPATRRQPGLRPVIPAASSEPSRETPAKGDSEAMDRALEELRKKIYQAKQEGAGKGKSKETSATAKPTAPAAGLQQKPMMPPLQKPVPPIKNMPPLSADVPELARKEPKRAGGASSFLLENVKQGLLEKDIQPVIVNQLMSQLTANVPFLKPSDIDSAITSALATMIPCSGFEINKRKSGKVISVVGPTGVGKTTCIAKLAVISKLLHKLDIGLISVDTYRLGAIDQLKIFSEISDIDFLVAYEAKDLPGLVHKFRNKDIIFLDTAGRSQNNARHLQEMKSVLSTVNVAETILVLSATAATSTLLDTAKKFAVFNYTGLIFTKLDEAVTYGNLLNVVYKHGTPIKYLTNGQVIPDDIIAAESEHIANIIYSGKVVAA
ncbi:MAG: flagellar biosynthesis protein FlhF [Ignavibacteria bacterium]|nr:flagellar biosynthesis protein FlhF [Ignavibacteria bacterium]